MRPCFPCFVQWHYSNVYFMLPWHTPKIPWTYFNQINSERSWEMCPKVVINIVLTCKLSSPNVHTSSFTSSFVDNKSVNKGLWCCHELMYAYFLIKGACWLSYMLQRLHCHHRILRSIVTVRAQVVGTIHKATKNNGKMIIGCSPLSSTLSDGVAM